MSERQITRTTAKIADLCDECLDPIWPGQPLAIYVERYISGSPAREQFVSRHYCAACAVLLEDSLTTTETV